MATDAPQTAGQANEPEEPETPPEVYYYKPWHYFRTMLLIAWSAFRHPFCSTVIDIETGEMRHYTDDEEAERG
jgi:hypothetical protein